MKRLIYEELLKWKSKSDRRPLLIQGVRQCGKTYIMEEFGRNEFESYIYCNFEQDPVLSKLFETNLDPQRIVKDIGVYKNTVIIPGRSLLIFDEIQECDAAITSLKYFNEKMPQLHLMCAGSLLGVSKSKASFPVGKIDHMDMFPMNFIEFVMADGRQQLADRLLSGDRSGISETIHNLAMDLLKDYCVVGGMPKVVSSWTEHHDITEVSRLQSEILADYEDDFGKHGSYMIEKLTSIWHSIPSQLSKENKRFYYKDLKAGGRADDYKDPVQWLVNAHLIFKVNQMKGDYFPSSVTEDDSLYKIYMCDIGLLRAMSGHPPGFMIIDDGKYRLYKGGMNENLVACELKSWGVKDIHYWKDGVYEVDLIIPDNGHNLPIEVKSGNNYRISSLKKFLKIRKDDELVGAVVVSADMPREGGIRHVPLYDVRSVINRTADEQEVRIDDSGIPFVRELESSSWAEKDSGYSLVISNRAHRKGKYPIAVLQVKDGEAWVDAGANISADDDGNITIMTAVPIEGRIIIK